MLRKPSAARHKIAVVNGPNMKYLGARNPEVFGKISSISDLENYIVEFGNEFGVDVVTFTSNSEPDIIEFIQTASFDGVIFNPAGLTLAGHSAANALSDCGKPYIEVHFANIENYYKKHEARPADSVFTFSATGLSMGMRQYSYVGALLSLALALDDETFLGSKSEDAK